MAINHRNQAIARVAYAVAIADGSVQKTERETLKRMLDANPDIFNDDDRADILNYFDDFGFQMGRPVLDAWRLKSLPVTLYNHDAKTVVELLHHIAEAHDGIVPAEATLLEQIAQKLASAPTAQA